ncbi:hypothetical protein COD09_18240 [Bacillus cereus]|uniref:Uncharacterized protein n=1 Tax=Bacillus cereus TaxID=1396 RepID=A0A2C1DH99_BACCE|nr:hypothetical protein COD09_18240 [Bacillus cereus]
MHFFIHSYPGAVLGFLFVTGLPEKSYKILHALSVVFFRNAGGIASMIKQHLFQEKNKINKTHREQECFLRVLFISKKLWGSLV